MLDNNNKNYIIKKNKKIDEIVNIQNINDSLDYIKSSINLNVLIEHDKLIAKFLNNYSYLNNNVDNSNYEIVLKQYSLLNVASYFIGYNKINQQNDKNVVNNIKINSTEENAITNVEAYIQPIKNLNINDENLSYIYK